MSTNSEPPVHGAKGGTRTRTGFRPSSSQPEMSTNSEPPWRCPGGQDRTGVLLFPKQAGQPLPYTRMERATGLEPVMSSLEGWRHAR